MNAIPSKIVPVGNSQGIRIPKVFLEMLGFSDNVVLTIHGNMLVVTSQPQSRVGWAEAFQRMHEAGDDVLLDGYVPTAFDDEEWA